ncbi:flagellin FliC [Bordetella hinzii]|uniref:Flagellin n=1 Tax=Bordetella hinzii TaxID=103855 RepID=A0AAN1S115_9BORD|nr:flagellin FliC [Bordetella hinzii]AKQ56022.1 Flagellin [Bordetella hinzii]AKQ60554.1 Flagellin [Bordetella hinzii]AZW19629.1 flagellin FliC [Bordetella hinzii]KXA70667.1 flagellin [Bordetella hinzii LMG 13501]MBZ0076422.1 flagellin FliC [Bordetella hinzii]
MAAVINTNYLSLVATNNLNKSQSALGTAIERLSSGLRINSAKDDAAGQAIANRFTANIKGLTQAARNANDGISIAQTTEGALNEINNNLQRIRELTVQAANGTNSTTDLESIQAEITQRLDEIDRVSAQTQFNGVKVLASDQTLTIQVGANDSQTIEINLSKIDKGTLGLNSLDVNKLAKNVKAGGFADGATIAATNATFAYTGAGATAITEQGVLKGSDGNYYVKDDKGNFYAASVSVASAGTSEVTVTIATSAAVSAATVSAAGLSPLADIDTALQKVDSLRSDLGAIQNRFESTVANLNNTVNNLSAARSRIEDSDYATEVSNMTKNQILQQAGTSVLAQANQVPQTVLSLLR